MPKHEHLYAGREFVMEGDKVPSGRMQGILLTQGNRHQIGKGISTKMTDVLLLHGKTGAVNAKRNSLTFFS